jgi:FtsH-binding integral membrane protein
MEFLKTAITAPLNNFGPIGLMIAGIVWVVMLYVGYRYSVTARKTSSILYILAFIFAIIMVVGLVLMLTTNVLDDKNSPIMSAYAVLALITFGQIGGFIAMMSASCGFMFGVVVRGLDAMTRGVR